MRDLLYSLQSTCMSLSFPESKSTLSLEPVYYTFLCFIFSISWNWFYLHFNVFMLHFSMQYDKHLQLLFRMKRAQINPPCFMTVLVYVVHIILYSICTYTTYICVCMVEHTANVNNCHPPA